MDPLHARATIALRLPTRTVEKERGIPVKQATPERISLSHSGHHRSSKSPASIHTGSSTLYTRLPCHLPDKNTCRPEWLLGGLARALELCQREWRNVGIVWRGKRVGFEPSQIHYLTLYSATDLRVFHCERGRKMPLSGSTRVCSAVFYARLRQTGSILDAERPRYAVLAL